MRTEGNALRIDSIAPTPLICGMMISVMTRSVGLRASSASASTALSAVRTEYPARSSTYFTESRTSGSSSTTKMLGIFASHHRCRDIADHFAASDNREKYSKCGSYADFRFNGDASTEALYDAMDHGKPQTRALSNRPRGKEWLKYALNGSRVHSPSRVANPEFNVGLRHGAYIGMLLISQANRQHAFRALHRLVGIGAQVHQQVRCERGVGSHEWKRLIDFRPYLDGRRGKHGKQVQRLGHHLSQVDQRELRIAELAAECQNLPNDILRTAGGRKHSLKIRAWSAGARQILQCCVGIKNDGNQHVVDFMSYTARERAHCLQPLTMS